MAGTSSTFGTRLLAALSTTGLWSSAVTTSGGLAFTGYMSGQIDFGLGALATHGTNDTDAFVVMVDPN